MSKTYETVIGLEVHVELATKTKIFCGCSTEFGGAPNTHTCPVCTGMPGSLPVLNKGVVEKAVAVGLATNCTITQNCKFDRKNYFYPDNPQNYQISQLYYPICRDGKVEIEVDGQKKYVRIHEIHMEEDAGKLVHDPYTDSSLVDFNRSGVPLIEIVSEPDMRSAEEVIAYLEKLRLIIQYLGASDCKLNEGSMRADVNLSVREVGSETFGTRTETKNLNSFKAIARAIENERERQIDLIESGEAVVQETRRWDDTKEYSYPMRSKEDAQDYRYFPDPDLVAIKLSDEYIENIKNSLPELPESRKKRYLNEYQLIPKAANFVTSSKYYSDIFEEAIKICKNPKTASNLLMTEVARILNEREEEPEAIPFSGKELGELVELIDKGTISSSIAKKVLEELFNEVKAPSKIIEEKGWVQISDEGAIKEVVVKIIEANPQSVADFKAGKDKALGFLVGQAMKLTKGKANPQMLNQMFKENM
jgi:aspartyl-tRNA(Asn)/glutamyl-tRNA(Gln) amidotransferase subunit B